MSSHSSQDENNNEIRGSDGGVNRVEVEPPSGKKRSTTERSSNEAQPVTKKKGRQRAEVWQWFVQREDNKSVCNCRFCGIQIGCDTKKTGTSSMIHHIKRCTLYATYVGSETQKVMAGDSSGVVTTVKCDKVLFRRSVNEMIVLNELPFSFVESEGFRRFCKNVLPMYTVHCRKTATTYIFEMFRREKEALKIMLNSNKKRVSLTIDIWTAPTTSYSYMVVTAHWIDANWDLQKRIISFKPVTDHKGETIANHLLECLDEWGIENVFTVTVDNAKGNDRALKICTDSMCAKGGLIRDGAYVHMRCCAHILNMIVKDGLSCMSGSIAAIRNAVKYVRSSYTRLKSFEMRVETGKVSRGSLTLDCITRWNSTYLILTAALKLRVAFEKMLAEDKLYNEYFMELEDSGKKWEGPPTSHDWAAVHRLTKFLKIFFNCTLVFSATKTVTSTVCYNEIMTIERNLISLSNHREKLVREDAMTMRAKFEKYWDGLINMNPLIIIASVFDPRNKMQYAALCFDTLYGKDSMESNHMKTSTKSVMKQIFEEYVAILCKGSESVAKSDAAESEHGFFDLSDDDDDDEDYHKNNSLYEQMGNDVAGEETSSELDIYLMEKPMPRNKNSLGLNYDVLAWWKRNSLKFPMLSEMAKDVLAIQVSYVASESAFSTSGRILDPFRSCLTPFMIEALVCTQQWLRNTIQSEKMTNLVQMFEELEFHDSLESNIYERTQQK